MDISHKNFLEVYEYDEKNYYLTRHFSDNDQIGTNARNAEDPYKYRIDGNVTDIQLIDKENSYYINELGLRGRINYKSDILAIGCSYTFGMGVPEEGIWHQILSKKINKDIINLSSPGFSTRKICEETIKFCTKYKMPKTIIALFPGFFRGMLLEDIDFYVSTQNMNPLEQPKIPGTNKPLFKNVSFDPWLYYLKNKNFMSFVHTTKSNYFESRDKSINYMENVFSPHQLILDNFNSIYLLQSFCASHNINFYWSTWHRPSGFLMTKLLKTPNFKLKNYIEFTENFSKYDPDNDDTFINKMLAKKVYCDSDHNSEFLNHPSWDIGSDHCIDLQGNKIDEWPSHPGIHYQTHIAEMFYNINI